MIDHVEVIEKIEVKEEYIDSPAVIIYNDSKEAVTLTHRNLIAAASSLLIEYAAKTVEGLVESAAKETPFVKSEVQVLVFQSIKHVGYLVAGFLG